jgi:tetratricopeptide (TPR) repeat protein
MEKSFDVTTRRSVYKEMGDCFSLINQPFKAINYYEKALALAKTIGEYGGLSSITLQLSKLHAKISDYKIAYDYYQLHSIYQDSLKQLTNDRNLVLLEVKKDEEKRLMELEELAAKQLRKKNIQYIAITIAIAFIFLCMILLGMFPISKFTIKALSFFAFICLFEFIVLLVDSYLHKLAHAEPLKIWLGKILVIALLVPIQHYMEHWVVKFLGSQKLLQLRKNFSLKNWWRKLKKPAPEEKEADFESDTAVL